MPNPLEQRIDRLERILIDGTTPLIAVIPKIETKLDTAIVQHESIKKWLIELSKESKELNKTLEPRIALLEAQIEELKDAGAEAKENTRTHYTLFWEIISNIISVIVGGLITYYFMT